MSFITFLPTKFDFCKFIPYAWLLKKNIVTFLAPVGCLQYFMGVSGTISSFNYNDAGGLMLSNTDYTICIRTERNFCGVQYIPCIDTGVIHSLNDS